MWTSAARIANGARGAIEAMTSPVDYDPFSPAVLAEPWPVYAALREHAPVHYFEDFNPPFYTLSRSEDVREALSNPEEFSIRYGQSPQYTRASGLMNDPPEHTYFRSLFNRGFTPRTVKELEPTLERIAGDLFDAMLPRGAGDLHRDFASPFPTMMIAELMGIPPEDHRAFRRMSDDLTATYNEPDPAVSLAPRQAFDAYFDRVIEGRRALLRKAGVDHPDESVLGSVLPDDLVSRLAVAELDGRRLEDKELSWTLLLLLLGGNETSTAMLTNLVWRLLQVPERWAALREDPGLVDAAVEESLRFDPPVLGLFRTPTRDLTLHGVTIPAKAKVMLLYAASNRDPEIFEDPDEFRLDRDPDETRRHVLTFGFGHHYCPGAALARLEARIALRMLLERAPELRLVGEPERIVPFNLWGRATLPLAW
ncbi:MAG: cytochrome P450 [Deltaproteobacteria bacterium]|jgi:cytochrome P450|nr:cytochrome P450 [Deltaproteobacteria bacterium]